MSIFGPSDFPKKVGEKIKQISDNLKTTETPLDEKPVMEQVVADLEKLAGRRLAGNLN